MLAYADPSVGLYLYIADLWLHGHLPYLAAWEYKPPGLFAYLGLALAATGDRMTLAMESVTTLSAFATAMLLWRLAPLVDRTGSPWSGRYAALFSILLSTENEGYLGDSEVLLAPFLAACFLIACCENATLGIAVWCGFLAGFALQMKLSVLPIVVLPVMIMARRTRRPAAFVAAYVVAALSPFLIEAAIYARAGDLGALIDANAGATFRRVVGLQRGIKRDGYTWFLAQFRVLAPALELAVFAVPTRVNARRLISWGWLGAAAFSILIVGEFYDRQFVLVQAPIALLGGIGLRACVDALGNRPALRRTLLAIVFLGTFGLHDYWESAQALSIVYRRAVLRQPEYQTDPYVALVRTLRREPRGSLFVIEESPLLYHDLQVTSPTRFPYTDHLIDIRMTDMTGVNGERELSRIFALDPRVVVAGNLQAPHFDSSAVALIERRLARSYRAVAVIRPGVTVYLHDKTTAAYPSRPR